MKNSVSVDGVTLTREQVERAMAELNQPDSVNVKLFQCRQLTGSWILLDQQGRRVMEPRAGNPQAIYVDPAFEVITVPVVYGATEIQLRRRA